MVQITRLGLNGASRTPYGSFAGKNLSRSVGHITRLGLDAGARPRYGSFAGKTSTTPSAPHVVDHLTRLSLHGGPRGLYGTFAGKTDTVAVEPEIQRKSLWLRSQAERDRLLREDREITELIMAVVRTGILDG